MSDKLNLGQKVVVGTHVLGGGVEVPSDQVDKDFWRLVLLYQFLYSLAGLIAGLACVIGGMFLFLNGIQGGGSWSADVFGVKITDAAPGVVLFILGIVLAQITAFTVRFSPSKAETPKEPSGK